jgi:Cys-tRNA(Pro)/Cys-tRNA(Cys) deacylase
MVVRLRAGDHLFVLVPDDREISWPKIRAALGVRRLSMPYAEAARKGTGYERGTMTPFGSVTALPVIVDERIAGWSISLGAGAHGVAPTVAADEVIGHLEAQLADVTDPA